MPNILLTAVSGLQASQQMLDVVGNNLANSNTSGFKSQSVNFSDLVYQTIKSATGDSSSTISGTDPAQVGAGVQVASITSNLLQGSLQTTGNSLDMAIQGSGYFVANDGTENVFTRAGSFGIDSENYLVDPATGNRIQRFGSVGEGTATTPAFQTAGNDSITIPYGTNIPGQSTENVTIQGNLNALAAGPQAEMLTSAQPFLSGSAAATSSTLLNSLDDNSPPYSTGDQITLQGTTAAGATVSATMNVDGTTTLGDVLSTINSDFPGSTATLDTAGNLVLTANANGPGKLSLTIADVSGNMGGTQWSNHAMAVTNPGSNGDVATTGVQFYDTQGSVHTMTLTFQKQADNTWNMTGALAPADGTMINNTVKGITFNANGSFGAVTGTTGGGASLTVSLTNLPVPQQINFNFGTTNGFNGLTQLGGSSAVVATKQDGFASGTLSRVEVGNDGTINGDFTNGQVLQLAQLAIASFANPQGLSRDGNNYFSLTSQSGEASIGTGTTGGRGTVSQGELETSNVDVSQEFTNLIIAQRAYQVNARALTTGNDVLQDLLQIIR